MSEINIGFEYEGVKSSIHNNHWVGEIPEYLHHLIYKPNERLNDGYEVLAEVRFIPFSKHDDLLFTQYYAIVNELIVKGVEFMEDHIGETVHLYSKESIEKENSNISLIEYREKINFIGEYIDYQFKHPMIIDGDEVKDWVNDEDCRWRGGGLHVNISPIGPKQCIPLIRELDRRLRPTIESFHFNSKYRKNILFRYRDYNGTPGVEYMSFGMNLTNEEEFIKNLNLIVSEVKASYNNLK